MPLQSNSRMRPLIVPVLLAASLAGCIRFDPADNGRADAAMAAGGVFLSTINKCLVHMERTKNTSTPECNASKEMEDYAQARRRVKKAGPEMEALEQRIEVARSAAESAMVRIALRAK